MTNTTEPIIQYERTFKDGNTAVLVSPGFGAGWSTWSNDAREEACVFDSRIVEKVLAGEDVTEEWLKQIWGLDEDDYIGTFGVEDLTVEWVPTGQRFFIEVYDGSESKCTTVQK